MIILLSKTQHGVQANIAYQCHGLTERKFQRAKGPGNERTRERIGQGPIGRFAPRSELAWQRKGSVPSKTAKFQSRAHAAKLEHNHKLHASNCYTPFTRYNRLSKRLLYNRFDNRLNEQPLFLQPVVERV